MTTHHCPKCSAQLPPDAPEGLCPKCLLDLAVSPTGAVGGSAGSDAADTAFSLESVQADFPQLEIIECIGRGGMGVVYKARQPGLDRIVALKVLAPKVKDDPAFAERFQREARALARLTHPNIVTLHDFGESNGRWYFLMEYVDGISVREALRGRADVARGGARHRAGRVRRAAVRARRAASSTATSSRRTSCSTAMGM